VHSYAGRALHSALHVFSLNGIRDLALEFICEGTGRENALTNILAVVHDLLDLGSVEISDLVTVISSQVLAVRQKSGRDHIVISELIHT